MLQESKIKVAASRFRLNSSTVILQNGPKLLRESTMESKNPAEQQPSCLSGTYDCPWHEQEFSAGPAARPTNPGSKS
ncbi:hypothetical protein PIIN_03276 [Serendipita indica DSM 11827]|uniref:Uncharacterized protein n=1 Tax=Serendipita indica (strain DSM 11827) TaxID=1109443 RepID=G4TDH3_SERID|nr:hypothetical protein PIIN_03276 [Serendipita indica DSM 11827]